MSAKDNDKIIRLIQERLELGRQEYKQGVDVHDTRYQWTHEALEEILDGMVYIAAAILRLEAGSTCPGCKNKKL